MPLTFVNKGQKVKLLSINAGHALTHRLASLGLVQGVEIIVLQNSLNGPFLISLKDTRIVLGRGMANKIMVQ